jgi:hypothetical protein
VFDPHATAEAIRILELKRVEAAPLPTSLWRFLHNASRRLDNELRNYFREDEENRRSKAA